MKLLSLLLPLTRRVLLDGVFAGWVTKDFGACANVKFDGSQSDKAFELDGPFIPWGASLTCEWPRLIEVVS